jgi:hypothetical protein
MSIIGKLETRVFNSSDRAVTLAASSGVAITAHDTNTFSPGYLYVGTGGDVKVKLADSATGVVFKNVPSGTFMPIIVTMVYVTGTVTATDFVILY